MKTETVQFHVENSDSEEDKILMGLLRQKIELLKSLIEEAVDAEDGISIEQAKRLLVYA